MDKRIMLLLLILAQTLLPALAKGENYPASDGFNIYGDVEINGTGVQAVAVQLWDGKIIIGGDFTITDHGAMPAVTRQNLARLNTDGTLDPSFVPDTDAEVRAIAIDRATKRVYIGGSFDHLGPEQVNGLGRLDPDGVPDPGFNPAGAGSEINAIALQPGSVLVGGSFTQMAGAVCGNIARIHDDGSPPETFSGGVTGGAVNAVLVQEDGMAVAGGSFTSPGTRLARFDNSGDPDLLFSAAPAGAVRSLALQTDGKILVGGDFTSIVIDNGPPQARNYLARLAWLDDHVELDQFDPALDDSVPEAGHFVASIAVQPDGKILAGGNFTKAGPTARNRMARLLIDGSLDKNANPHMEFDPNADAAVQAIAIQPDEKILIGGNFAHVAGEKSRTRLARFYAGGALDEDVTIGDTMDDGVSRISLLPDGSMVLGGYFSNMGGEEREFFARLYPDWSLAGEPDIILNGYVDALVPQPDGKFIVGGGIWSIEEDEEYISSVRFNADWTMDLAYNEAIYDLRGHFDVVPIVQGLGPVSAIALSPLGPPLPDGQPDVDIYLGAVSTDWVAAIVERFNSAGGRNETFAANIRNLPAGLMDGWVRALVIQPDDKKVLVGTDGGSIFRLHANGELDTSFQVRSLNSAVVCLLLQPDGQILANGRFKVPVTRGGSTWQQSILRLNKSDGSIDNTFNVQINANYPDLYGIALQTNGDMVIYGSFVFQVVDANGVTATRENIFRLGRNGELDGSADQSGAPARAFDLGIFQPTAGELNEMAVVNLQSDGKLLIGGAFSSINGQTGKRFFTRFSNGWATQELSVSPDGKEVTWLRGGTGPELWRAVMHQSADGSDWKYLGEAAAIPGGGGWRLENANLGDLAQGRNTNRYVRATGYMTGQRASSNSLTESVRLYHLKDGPQTQSQSIIFGAITDRNYGDSDFAPGATSTSGLTVSYTSSNPAVAIVVNGQIRITGAGDTVITASQEGDGSYGPADQVSLPFTVKKKVLTVTAEDKARAYRAANPALTAGYDGFVAGEDACVVSGAAVLWTAASQESPVGSYDIVVGVEALAADNYSFTPVHGTLSVFRSCQEILFPPIGDRTYGDPPFELVASACSGLGISFASSDPQVAQISAGTVTLTGAGSAVITASQEGTGELERAPDVSQTVMVHRSGQALSFTRVARKVLGDPPFSLAATASSGLPVSFLSSDPQVAAVSGSTVTLTGAGTAVITALQEGNGNYNAALPDSWPLTVAPEGIPPLIALSTLCCGAVTSDPVLNIMGAAGDASGIASLTVNGADLTGSAALFSSAVELAAGRNSISVTAKDGAGNSATQTLEIVLDAAAPAIELSEPADNSVTNLNLFTARGTVTPGSAVALAVNGAAAQSLSVTDGAFAGSGYLAYGVNTIELSAALSGRVSRVKRSVTLAPGKPFLAITGPARDMRTEQESVLISGIAGATGSDVRVVLDVDGSVFTPALQAGTFQQLIRLNRAGQFRITASATDGGGNASVAQRNIVKADRIRGDLDGDGCVDVRDAWALLRISLGMSPATGEALAHGDVAPLVNGIPQPDGRIDVGDVLVLLRKIVGLVDF